MSAIKSIGLSLKFGLKLCLYTEVKEAKYNANAAKSFPDIQLLFWLHKKALKSTNSSGKFFKFGRIIKGSNLYLNYNKIKLRYEVQMA